MALLGNYSVFNKLAGRFLGGGTAEVASRANWNTPNSMRNAFMTFSQLSAIPRGARPPVSWMLANKDGDMASYDANTLSLNGSPLTMSAGIAAAGNGTLTLTGTASLTLAAFITGSAPILLTATGLLQGVVFAAGNGTLTLNSGVTTLTGTLDGGGTATLTLTATGSAIAVSPISGTAGLSLTCTPATLDLLIQAAGTAAITLSGSAVVTGAFPASGLATITLNASALPLTATAIAAGTAVMTLTGSALPHGTGFMTTDLFPTVTPASIANAVWNSLAASFNVPGTMGEAAQTGGGGGGYTPAQIADAVLAALVEDGYSLQDATRLILAVLAGDATGLGSSPVFKSMDGTKTRVASAPLSGGGRTITTRDPT